MRFDRVGVFTYSAEEGTPSFALPDPVPAKVMRARKDALMAAQQPISLANNQQWLGRELDVLVESRRGPDAVGRSFRDAPEIDGSVTIRTVTPAPASSSAPASPTPSLTIWWPSEPKSHAPNNSCILAANQFA